MRLKQQTEWAIAGILIVYLTFTPGFQFVRDLLSTSLGKAAFLVVVAYVWKNVSTLIAILLLLGYVRCATMREGMEDGSIDPVSCTCKGEGFVYDAAQKMCRNERGDLQDPSCMCPAGYVYNKESHKCIQRKTEMEQQEPMPPPANPTAPPPEPPAEEGPAPKESGASAETPAAAEPPAEGFTNPMPLTTPGGAHDTLSQVPAGFGFLEKNGPRPNARDGYFSW
jgi:hypothetical protein